MPMPWFRVYSETLSDRKLARVARMTGLRRPMILGFWIGILCLANDSPQRGCLLLAEGLPLTIDDIVEELGADAGEFVAAMTVFEALGMISKQQDAWQITNWQSRQFVSDNSTDRVRKHRAKQMQQRSCNVSGTFLGNAPEAEADTDTDTDTEADADADPATAALGQVYARWLDARGGTVNALDGEQIGDLCDLYTPAWVEGAILEANRSKQGGMLPIKYVERILERWKREGFQAPFKSGDHGARQDDPELAERGALEHDWMNLIQSICEGQPPEVAAQIRRLRPWRRHEDTFTIRAKAPDLQQLQVDHPDVYEALIKKVTVI